MFVSLTNLFIAQGSNPGKPSPAISLQETAFWNICGWSSVLSLSGKVLKNWWTHCFFSFCHGHCSLTCSPWKSGRTLTSIPEMFGFINSWNLLIKLPRKRKEGSLAELLEADDIQNKQTNKVFVYSKEPIKVDSLSNPFSNFLKYCWLSLTP